MLAALACVTLVALAIIVVLIVVLRAHADAHAQWAAERRELVTRIQAPERIPIVPAGEYVIPEREPDEWAKVGQVDIADDYGLDDE